MVKQIGDIKLYSVKDLHEAFGVNERTIRDWFNKGRVRGQKVGKEWYVTEENLKRFLSGEEGSKIARDSKKTRKLRILKKRGEKG